VPGGDWPVAPFVAHLILGAGWASFGIVHSLLAGERVKSAMLPAAQPYYRVGYNVLASLHLAFLFWLEQVPLPVSWAPALGETRWALIVLQAVGWIVMLWALRAYDLSAFSGLGEARAALRQRFGRRSTNAPDDAATDGSTPAVEPLATGGLNAFVRHPLYSGLFLVLWARVSNDLTLATALWGSLYLVIGSRFEERRLLRVYGEAYARYRAAVPAFVPWKGRAWRG